MTSTITESRFYMWRCLFAIAHADEVVSMEERNFMHKTLQTYPFSEAQKQVLEQDIELKQDVRKLFPLITDPNDRSQFFDYARTLVWCDGDYGAKEQDILLALKKIHVQSADQAFMEQDSVLELEDEPVRQDFAPSLPRQDGFFARLFRGQGKKRWP